MRLSEFWLGASAEVGIPEESRFKKTGTLIPFWTFHLAPGASKNNCSVES